MSSEIFEEVDCTVCGKSMGVFDTDELIVLMLEGIDSVKCFDCEPRESEQVGAIYKSWYFCGRVDREVDAFEQEGKDSLSHARAHERTHERTHARGSSSYTNLNRFSKNRVLLGNGLEVTMCEDCQGMGEVLEFGVRAGCGICDGLGSIPVAIVIPLWIIQEGGNNV